MALVKMSALLKRAEEKNIGCGAFNVGNMEMLSGVVKAAEEMAAPVIIQIAQVRLSHSPLELMGPMMVEAARRSKVDIAVHLDHGSSVEVIKQALDYGFTSVMFDGSGLPLEENVKKTAEVKRLAEGYGADTEGELGVVGGSEGGGKDSEIKYTEPEEAESFCRETGVDALAVAIGNAHGNYRGEPKLAFDVLEEIDKVTETPLVLHGGSGISDKDYIKAISLGIRKLNIATANFSALAGGVEEYARKTERVDFFKLNEIMIDSVYRNVKKHINVFSVKSQV